jgi:hypothetical protein
MENKLFAAVYFYFYFIFFKIRSVLLQKTLFANV